MGHRAVPGPRLMIGKRGAVQLYPTSDRLDTLEALPIGFIPELQLALAICEADATDGCTLKCERHVPRWKGR